MVTALQPVVVPLVIMMTGTGAMTIITTSNIIIIVMLMGATADCGVGSSATP